MTVFQGLRRPRPAPTAFAAFGWLMGGFASAFGAGFLAMSTYAAGVGSAGQDEILAIFLVGCVGYVAARRDPTYFASCLSGVVVAILAAYTWLMWALGAWS